MPRFLVGVCALLSLVVIRPGAAFTPAEKQKMRDAVVQMFYHGYNNYKTYAFPHDELKPLSKTYTDSLGELGNLNLEHLSDEYQGVALTLIDSLSTLAIMGNWSEFESNINWLGKHVSFAVNVRVNLFEANIRILGGLLSAHLLAQGPGAVHLKSRYKGHLLDLAYDLGKRLLPAFRKSPTGLPYAWINLRDGVREGEVTETNTAACGTLLLEFGILSRLTGDPSFEAAALRSLRALWNMRTELGLWGTSLDMTTAQWRENIGGIGAGADSFYEYLLKAYVLFGDCEFWCMFQQAYVPAQRYYRVNHWYTDADIYTGKPVHMQFVSLQAFWPGLQVLAGDVPLARQTFWNFFSLWEQYGLLPERYLLNGRDIHPTERYYPLRPELVESAFYMYQATKETPFLEAGQMIYNSLMEYTKVEGGFASVRNVRTKQLEDHMQSFFLAETCKYLYLLFDDSFLKEHKNNYVFTTEGHPIPLLDVFQPAGRAFAWPAMDCCVGHPFNCLLSDQVQHHSCPMNTSHHWRHLLEEDTDTFWERLSSFDKRKSKRKSSYVAAPTNALDAKICPIFGVQTQPAWSLCHVLDKHEDAQCTSNTDCGVDHASCQPRTCSTHGFCQS